ncbi:hypothetical protein ACHAWF_009285 [Thalassiosira exigua]
MLSCFRLQIDLSLVKLLDSSPLAPPGGVLLSLSGLVERGVVEESASSIAFAHDLIQENVYESIPPEERREPHLDMGAYLGAMTALDASSAKFTLEGGVDHLHLLSDDSSFSGSDAKPAMLASIATDQVNAAGPQAVHEGVQRARFAAWNLHAGREAEERSNFQTALHHYRNGIAFLAEGPRLGDVAYQLWRELHEGAALAAFALGDDAQVGQFTQAIIDRVPFEDSLVAQDLRIRSLKEAGKYTECIARGLAMLRLLKIDVPSTPSPETVIGSMRDTESIASKYMPQLTNMKQTANIDARKQRVLTITDAVIVACYREASPFLPLVTCAMINYSLQNRVCEVSATAFVVMGYIQIFLADNYLEGKNWGDTALKILDKNSTFTTIGFRGWCHAKYERECLKYSIVDLLIIDELTGSDSFAFSALEGAFQDENHLLADAKHRKHNQGIEAIYTLGVFSRLLDRELRRGQQMVRVGIVSSFLQDAKGPGR